MDKVDSCNDLLLYLCQRPYRSCRWLVDDRGDTWVGLAVSLIFNGN